MDCYRLKIFFNDDNYIRFGTKVVKLLAKVVKFFYCEVMCMCTIV